MAKTNNTRRMVAMALAAAVTVTALPVDAYAASAYSSKVARAQKKADAAKTKQQEKINEHLKEIKVTISTEVIDDPETEEIEDKNVVTETFGDPAGTQTGDVPDGPDDKEYNYEETVQQGSVTVETTENENGENNVEFVTGVTGPTGDNDIIYEEDYFDKAEGYYEENELDMDDFLPAPGNEEVTEEELGQLEIPGEEDESRYELITQGATSQFRPLPVYTKPMSDEDKVAEFGNEAYIRLGESAYTYYVKWLEEATGTAVPKVDGQYVTDEEGYILGADGERVVKTEKTVTVDGTTYYMHRFAAGNLAIDGWYNDEDGDGVWNPDDVTYKGVWEEAAQFILVDKVTGELITTYAEDYVVKKWAVGAEYYMQNLEDSAKFGEYADNIRAIAQAGYWGTADGIGSLDAMKAALKDAGFSDEELGSLTDGVALAATQMAIYYYANADFGQEFINVNYDVSGNVSAGTAVPEDKQDEASLLFKLYDYLKNLAPVEAATKVEDIIANDNFLDGDMEITVLEKVDDGDDNDDNDSYKTNLTFALVVTPGEGDELVVKVVNAATGEAIAEGCIAGENKNMEADENGNYTFKDIVMTEGDHQYNITMEGVQNLKEGGVYLFTADVPEGTKPQPSMIGMTSDKNQVNVESLNFSFEVDDEKVVVREKRSKGGSNGKTETIVDEDVPMSELPEIVDEEIILDEDVPMSELPEIMDEEIILDEDVPMSEMPGVVLGDEEVSVIAETGDSNHMTAGFGGMFAALAGMMMLKRRKEN